MCAFSAVLTTPAHSPEQPAVVSDLSLHERSRRAHLHHRCSTTTSDTTFYIATPSCVRGAQISAVFHLSARRDRRSHAATCVIRRKTNRRHMNGDHHGRTARRATLLIRAVDEILGTHSHAAPGNLGQLARRYSPIARR